MNSGSSAPISSGGQSAATASRCSCHQWSRPGGDGRPRCRHGARPAPRSTPGHSLQRFVDVGLQRHQLAAAHAVVGGDDQLAVAILDPARQRLGREAGEHDRMDRADPRAGEHRHRRLGDHRQVDRDPVAAPGAERLEHVGQAADVGVELAVSERALLRGVVALPDDRHGPRRARQGAGRGSWPRR